MQARLRAQLGDWSEYSGERRRRSVVIASIVLTITDPLRGSYPFGYYLQAALIRSCGASFACMELTIISRFQRLQASTKFLIPFTIRQQCIIYPQYLFTESILYICEVCGGVKSTALSFNMEKRRQSPLPHLWRMGHFFFVLYVSILSFSQKACFCHF